MNFSTAKQKYSFGKEQRFNEKFKIYNENIYLLPSTLKKRNLSFGIGDRFRTPN